MTHRPVLDVFVPVVGWAESWSLRASGQAFVVRTVVAMQHEVSQEVSHVQALDFRRDWALRSKRVVRYFASVGR